ncbi:MAG: helix-turn-helix domain containing protein [Bryobacteraceae bacterium]|nr:helix-turn-helix domain containing protein [Bryobacteraceae bacterium]
MGRYPLAFKKQAVERLKSGDNVLALSEELGVHRRMLYRWRDQLVAIDDGDTPPENVKERDLRIQLAWRWSLSRVPCKKSRLDARAVRGLARRHLRPNPGVDDRARQVEYRANVPVGMRKAVRASTDRCKSGSRWKRTWKCGR